MAVVSMKQLLEAGVHFGHQTRRWNPKMKRFIFGERNGIYIIDLHQTRSGIEKSYIFVRDLVADGGTVLFIGTKKQTQDPVAEFAVKTGMPYVNQRWLGGMLTNFTTISRRVAKLQDLQRMREAGDFENMPKKEALLHTRELEKLDRNLGGLKAMKRLPDAVFIIDTKKEHIAVTEANKLGIPVVAVVDTNCDPDPIDFVIPGNDDAIRSGHLLCRVLADAVEEGQHMAARRRPAESAGPAVRTPEQEAAHQAQQVEARRQAAAQAAERAARLATAEAASTTADAVDTTADAVDTTPGSPDPSTSPAAAEVEAPEVGAAEVEAPEVEATTADDTTETQTETQPPQEQ
ncbi:MAG: 30S ribosomal protein S2 [Acidimicrobiales bacterium]